MFSYPRYLLEPPRHYCQHVFVQAFNLGDNSLCFVLDVQVIDHYCETAFILNKFLIVNWSKGLWLLYCIIFKINSFWIVNALK